MNTSQQATGRNFPRDDNYPFRTKVLACTDGAWWVLSIFECATEAMAHANAAECIEAFKDGCEAMHYIVGEVGFDSDGYPLDQPREWSEEELAEVRRREFSTDNYGRDI